MGEVTPFPIDRARRPEWFGPPSKTEYERAISLLEDTIEAFSAGGDYAAGFTWVLSPLARMMVDHLGAHDAGDLLARASVHARNLPPKGPTEPRPAA